MKIFISSLVIFFITFILYLGVSSKFTFRPKWALDYFNPMAQSIIHGHFDLVNPATTYDLVHFHDKWYAPWGMLPALMLIPLQIIRGQFIPTIYLTVFFASLNIVVVYLLLLRVKQEFFADMKMQDIYLLLLLLAFGTTQFYVGTLGSVWHVDQMVTAFFGTLGIYIIFKRIRHVKDYFFSALILSVALLGRATIVLLIILPACLYMWDYLLPEKFFGKKQVVAFIKGMVIFCVPLVLFSTIFFYYNIVRFGNPFEYGYRYILEAPSLQQVRKEKGVMSVRNIPTNLWYMFLEIPRFNIHNRMFMDINLKGNSIFFLTPPFLAIFLALPIVRLKRRFSIDLYRASLWISAILTMLPSLMIYSTGWIQFGFRYSLDITVIVLLLSLFGVKGKLSNLYIVGIAFAIGMHIIGVFSLL